MPQLLDNQPQDKYIAILQRKRIIYFFYFVGIVGSLYLVLSILNLLFLMLFAFFAGYGLIISTISNFSHLYHYTFQKERLQIYLLNLKGERFIKTYLKKEYIDFEIYPKKRKLLLPRSKEVIYMTQEDANTLFQLINE